MVNVAKVNTRNFKEGVFEALEAVSAASKLPESGLVILKPNLTNASPPPVTTNIKVVEAVHDYCRMHTDAEIAIGEGCGSGTTAETFKSNGYDELALKHNLELLDFNKEEYICERRRDTFILKRFYMPKIVGNAFIVSIPVLKDHSFTVTTIAMKNMFGIAPAPMYGGSWNKARLHTPSTHQATVDICMYKKPDLCVVDATVALAGSHLSGTPRQLNTILAGFDPVAVDSEGSRMMGHEPENIEYLKLADGILGRMG